MTKKSTLLDKNFRQYFEDNFFPLNKKEEKTLEFYSTRENLAKTIGKPFYICLKIPSSVQALAIVLLQNEGNSKIRIFDSFCDFSCQVKKLSLRYAKV